MNFTEYSDEFSIYSIADREKMMIFLLVQLARMLLLSMILVSLITCYMVTINFVRFRRSPYENEMARRMELTRSTLRLRTIFWFSLFVITALTGVVMGSLAGILVRSR